MEQWLGVALVVIVAALAVFIAFCVARRLILGIGNSVFDCALRVAGPGDAQGRWRLGLARYYRNLFLWYPKWGFTMGPKLVLARGRMDLLDTREADQYAPFGQGRIVRLRTGHNAEAKVLELGLGPGSTMGLLSWVEAAPPGGDELDSERKP